VFPVQRSVRETFAQLLPDSKRSAALRSLKIRTGQGMVLLTAEEARALKARLAGSESAQSASGTLAVSANASTSVTFTEVEKVAVLDILVDWLGPTSSARDETGLAALQSALARDLGKL
jgi:hypothetical protein